MLKLVGLRGTSCAGKNTLSNYIHGLYLKKIGFTSEFRINASCGLEIKLEISLPNGGFKYEWKPFEVDIQHFDFRIWASIGDNSLWTYVRSDCLARPLKDFCINVLGLTVGQVYGNDKASPTQFRFKDIAFFLDSKWFDSTETDGGLEQQLTARDIMEYVGTKLIRRMYPDAFIDSLLRRVEANPSPLTLITDVRRANESKKILEAGGKIVHLTRGNPQNISESDINNVEPSVVLDNSSLTIEQSCEQFEQMLRNWDYLETL